MRHARASGRVRLIGRLTKRPDFVAAASGRRFHTERMTVQGRRRIDRLAAIPPADTPRALSGPDASGQGPARLRFGFTVTKRVGHATERNRIKRRLRAAVLDAARSHADMPVDVVVIARRDALTAPYAVLIQDLEKALLVVTKPKLPRPEPRPGASSPSSIGDERRGPPHA